MYTGPIGVPCWSQKSESFDYNLAADGGPTLPGCLQNSSSVVSADFRAVKIALASIVLHQERYRSRVFKIRGWLRRSEYRPLRTHELPSPEQLLVPSKKLEGLNLPS